MPINRIWSFDPHGEIQFAREPKTKSELNSGVLSEKFLIAAGLFPFRTIGCRSAFRLAQMSLRFAQAYLERREAGWSAYKLITDQV